jgi:hypothetical protein
MPMEQVGVILVHGIGEQRRFQHLDGQLRDLVESLAGHDDVQRVSVDISAGRAAAFHAEQDTWNVGPEATVTVTVEHTLRGAPTDTQLKVHEVWWADVNEPYSLAKQFRFWLWGLAIWAHPGKRRSGLGSADRVAPPEVPGGKEAWDRLRLYMVACFFALLGFSIGTLTFLAKRLLLLQTPAVLRVLSNYLSSVKLYNQSWRYGAGLVWAHEDFLDAVGDPPRVSVRRRMIRTIADVACNNYDRWYILAHSQGSVVAFNGLMETAYAWPGYLDQDQWVRLCQTGLAGPALPSLLVPAGRLMPRRPGWAAARDIAYRRRIFSRLRGLLTYGSPLEKFAGIWPALVPISREPAMPVDVSWLNLVEPTDPVAGRLLAYDQQPVACCPQAVDIGYAGSWWLLLSHLKYLTRRRAQPDAATATITWLLTDNAALFSAPPGASADWRLGTWFGWRSIQWRVHRGVAWASWLGAAVILLFLGAIILPMLLEAAGALLDLMWQKVADLIGFGTAANGFVPSEKIASVWHWIVEPSSSLLQRMIVLAVAALIFPLVIGSVHWAWTTLRADHMNPGGPSGGGQPSPAPGAPGFVLPTDEPP